MKLVIYQTSDLHGFVYPTNYVKEQPLGILKIGSYIKEDEKKYDASLKIDCGDLIQGSALTHYLSKHEMQNNPIIQGMEEIGYDAYVLGNHEFNYGLEYLNKSYSLISGKVINANIEGLEFETKPYKIFDFDGFRIGCIGLTTSFIPNWENEENIKGITFNNPVEMYAKYEQELKDNCDYIVVCYHGGFEKSLDSEMNPTESLTKENQGSELLENFDSIDMILSGHQHRSFITKINGVVCSQPLNNGQNFTKIVLDTKTKELSYDLISIKDLDTKIDENLQNVFEEVENNLQAYLDQVIGSFDKDMLMEDLFKARLEGHPFINFLHEVHLNVSGADFSAISMFDTAIGFKEEVTIRDVLINYPYPNTLKVLEVSGEKIKEAMEKSATYFVKENDKVIINNSFLVPKVQNYNYDTFGGMTYEIDLDREFGNRIISIKKDNEELDLDKSYMIVMNNYRATNTALYPAYEGAKIVGEINTDISEIIINYIQNKKSIKVIDESNYKVKY
ncbi:MAG: bifunctional metallophosphatase/5'-nucleotidase [Peptostreptococcaceae bacterium]